MPSRAASQGNDARLVVASAMLKHRLHRQASLENLEAKAHFENVATAATLGIGLNCSLIVEARICHTKAAHFGPEFVGRPLQSGIDLAFQLIGTMVMNRCCFLNATARTRWDQVTCRRWFSRQSEHKKQGDDGAQRQFRST